MKYPAISLLTSDGFYKTKFWGLAMPLLLLFAILEGIEMLIEWPYKTMRRIKE